MPAEWAPHIGCLVSWPCKEETWGGHFNEAKKAYIDVIRGINRFEHVTVLSDPGTAGEARSALGGEAAVHEIPLDDSWIRDNGPIFLKSEDGKLAMVQFEFNGWGGRFLPCDRDAEAPEHLAEHLKIRRYTAPMVLEGGAITVDGEGTLLTTESCILNKNRNPDLTKELVEKILKDYLGVKKVLWVPQGIFNSMIDGHIDGVAAFVRPGIVIHASSKDESDPNYEVMKNNRAALETQTDAKGRSLEIINFPMPVRREINGDKIAPCYTNFYIANGGIVAPVFGDPNDVIALGILRQHFPKHVVVGVRSEFIGVGGGEVHCITQQIPTGTSLYP
ncbi:MAG: agmatine deiminase family protein [Thermoplasmata archaeon]|nr:agmatine deiminase family protein [Thermoplasmata archaeon]